MMSYLGELPATRSFAPPSDLLGDGHLIVKRDSGFFAMGKYTMLSFYMINAFVNSLIYSWHKYLLMGKFTIHFCGQTGVNKLLHVGSVLKGESQKH